MEQTLEERLHLLEDELSISKLQENYLQEALSDAVASMLAMDNEGWNLISGVNVQDGLTLVQLQRTGKLMRDWAMTNPLMLRAHDLRCAYMFGNGYSIGVEDGASSISVRAQKLIDNQINQDALFSRTALKTNERSRLSDGGLFVLFDKNKNTFQRIPFHQISDCITDPDNNEIIWYYKRTWTRMVANPRTGVPTETYMNVWYKTDRAIAAGAANYTRFRDDIVDPNFIILDDLVNRIAGATWGMPDGFAAAPWALAYSSYLKDGIKVMSALAAWVWKLTPKTKKGGDAAGTTIKTSESKAATVITDMDMTALPKAGTVDLTTGRPLAAMVASTLGVDVSVLLADEADQAGRPAAPVSGDVAIRVLTERQEVNGDFLERCLKLLGITAPCIKWEKMEPDADFREQQTLAGALGTGLFYGDEIRGPLAKVAGIELLHSSTPPGFMLPNNSKSSLLITNDQNAVAQAGTAPASGVKTDGTTDLTNGQGKSVAPTANTLAPKANPTAKPSYGVNDKRNTGGRGN